MSMKMPTIIPHIVLRSGTEELWIASLNARNLGPLPQLGCNATGQWLSPPHFAEQTERSLRASEAETQFDGASGAAGDFVSERAKPLRKRSGIRSSGRDATNRHPRTGQDSAQSAAGERLLESVGEYQGDFVLDLGRTRSSSSGLRVKRGAAFAPSCLTGIN